ncbi:efflux RND transporter permease subunit [Emcibacter nanhaiensis]|uniref:Multidrug transporter n=1 Tax=Emcibacter nanhaiensis TaxID=1505037 RepID=A0A501PK40_9PROT|nr:efflux RND transporter permease subunit [Emcibacter nanhaiensis]TPD60625.1 multidrug transporter [Emcibacter nanhaiensis]
MAAQKLSRFVVRFPVWFIAGILLVSSLLGYFAWSGLSLKVVLEEMLPVGRTNVQLIQKFGTQFGGANTTLIALENENGTIYDREFLENYMKISDEIYFHPETIRHLVQSLSLRKTKAVTGSGGRIQIDALMWGRAPDTDEKMQLFRRNVKAQYQGFLVSDDERSAMIVADFKDGADYEQLVNFIDDIRVAAAEDGIKVYAVGRPILLGIIYRALDKTLLILAISVLFVAAILYVYFQNLIGVCVPIISATMATFWGLGAMGYVHYNLDPLLILLPAFIFAIVLSHSVQFISRVFEEFSEHHHMRDAVQHGLAKLMFPSMAAIVTDAAGFTVLVLVGIPSIQALAVICTIWLLAIGPSLIFSAALLCLLPRPGKYRTGIHLVERVWSAMNLEKHAFAVTVAGLLALGGGLWGSGYLTIGDATGSPILWPGDQYNRDNEALNKSFSGLGTDLMQVYIEGGDNTMLDPEVYHRIEALDRHVYETVPQARPAQSLVPVIKKINSVLYEGDPSYEIVPETTEEIGFNIYLFRSKGEPGDFAAYTNPEWQIGNITIPLKDHSGQTVDKVIAEVAGFLGKQPALGNGAKFLFAGGQIGIAKAVNDEIRASNNTVLIAIVLVITFCVFVLYRSVSVSLVLIASLAAANFITYSFMAFKGIGLSLNTLPLTALGVGLGVDYGIYMLDRIREEARVHDRHFEAVRGAIRTSGNAIFVTAMTMVLPLIPWFLFSALRFQAEMGLLLGMVLFLNMIGALVFVPAAVLYLKPKAIFGDPESGNFKEKKSSEIETSMMNDSFQHQNTGS